MRKTRRRRILASIKSICAQCAKVGKSSSIDELAARDQKYRMFSPGGSERSQTKILVLCSKIRSVLTVDCGNDSTRSLEKEKNMFMERAMTPSVSSIVGRRGQATRNLVEDSEITHPVLIKETNVDACRVGQNEQEKHETTSYLSQQFLRQAFINYCLLTLRSTKLVENTNLVFSKMLGVVFVTKTI